MSHKLDKVDLRIMHSLAQDARKAITQLSVDAGISRPTAINRLKKLRENGILSVHPLLMSQSLDSNWHWLPSEPRVTKLVKNQKRAWLFVQGFCCLFKKVETVTVRLFCTARTPRLSCLWLIALRVFQGLN